MRCERRTKSLSLLWLLFVVAVAAAVAHEWGEIRAVVKERLPIRFVRVEGTFQYLEKQDIQAALTPLAKTSFLEADLRRMRKAAQTLPWIERAQVRRIWPDTIVVRVYERQPYARWGKESLLTPRGERFMPAGIERFQALPLVHGPLGHEVYLLGVLKKMEAALASRRLALEALVVNERRAWTVQLDGGVTIQLGRREPFKAFVLMLRVLPVLGEERIARIERIDLRYPNGFAVSWKPKQVIQGEPEKPPVKSEINKSVEWVDKA